MENFICKFFYFLGCVKGHMVGISRTIKMRYMGMKIDIWTKRWDKFDKELKDYTLYLEETRKRLESELNA